MTENPSAGPQVELAPWLALAALPNGADAVGQEVRARLAALRLRAYGTTGDPIEHEAPDIDAPVAVVLPGRSPSLRPLVLSARLDRREPAALAALAAALAVPSLLADADLERDVVVVFTREDDVVEAPNAGRSLTTTHAGGLERWFEQQRRHDVKAAVLLAPIVRPVAAHADLIEVAGVETDARMPTVLHGCAPPGSHLVLTRHGPDGVPFATYEAPYLRIGTARSAPAGAPGGTSADLADLERLAGRTAIVAATLLARLDGARLPGPYNGYDSTDVELAAATEALGPLAAAFGGAPRTRGDLDRIVAALGL